MVWIAVIVMASLSGVVQAISGFGAGILMMSVLPYFFDMVTSSAIGSAVSIGATATLAWKFRKHMDLKITLLPALVYVACSLTVLNFIQDMDMEVLTLAFGVFLIVLSLYSFLFSKRMKLQMLAPFLARSMRLSANRVTIPLDKSWDTCFPKTPPTLPTQTMRAH